MKNNGLTKPTKIMLLIAFLLVIITLFLMVIYLISDSNSSCFMIDSRCLDLTNANELSLGVCNSGYTCNEYCQRTYGTTVKWVSKCITNGLEECINVQACVCETK
jgi:hypothetical protein